MRHIISMQLINTQSMCTAFFNVEHFQLQCVCSVPSKKKPKAAAVVTQILYFTCKALFFFFFFSNGPSFVHYLHPSTSRPRPLTSHLSQTCLCPSSLCLRPHVCGSGRDAAQALVVPV